MRDGCSSRRLEQRGIFLRRHHAQAREQRHDVDGEGDEERIAPAPVEEIVSREITGEIGEQRARHDQAERRAELRNHRVPATALGGGAFSASSEAMPSQAPPSARPWPMRTSASSQIAATPISSIAGQERERHGGCAEQEQRDVSLAAAVLAVDRHEDDGADRPRDEGQREDHEGIEGAGQLAREREHQAREHHHRGDGVDEEVEEFRGAADDDADGDLAGTGLVVAMLARVRCLPLRGSVPSPCVRP